MIKARNNFREYIISGNILRNLVGKVQMHSGATKKSWSIRRMTSYMYPRGTEKSVYLLHTFKNTRNTERMATYSS